MYAIGFNNPYGLVVLYVCTAYNALFLVHRDKIATGSFDKTCKVCYLPVSMFVHCII